MPESTNNTDRALVACSLWLHVGFVGAAALAAGLIQLFDGEANWLSALGLALSGGVLAAACWLRSRTVLERAERASAVAPVTSYMVERRTRDSRRLARNSATTTLSSSSTAFEAEARR